MKQSEFINKAELESFAMKKPGGMVRLDEIHKFQATDFAPVMHGEWLKITEFEGTGKKRKEVSHKLICSICKETATAGCSFYDNATPYCPWCGAKMDGEHGHV